MKNIVLEYIKIINVSSAVLVFIVYWRCKILEINTNYLKTDKDFHKIYWVYLITYSHFLFLPSVYVAQFLEPNLKK